MWLEALRTKDEAFRYFKKIKAAAETERECKLLAFRSDRGGEFNSDAFVEFCEENGIKHNTTASYSPQQNGVVERRNQTVVEMARCLLKSMIVPGMFWGEAVKTAVYLLNRAPTRSVQGMTPYEAWHKRKPSVHHLRTFGCVAHVKNLGPGIHKISDRSTPGVFVGYEEGAKAYRVYDPVEKRLYVTRDVVFEEHRAWNWEIVDGSETGTTPATFIVIYTTETSDPTPEPGEQEPEPRTPVPILGQTQWATPPTHDDTRNTDSGFQRYRRVKDIYDATDEVVSIVAL
ncbi:hypothetical protein MLD38_005363 [Melastoma candidum]|uniref:Uncharacterized protein n=1 Tax=Melastoma candidum TaxID=119954 RepID=A0ACB9S8I2_9MYRT|nr:hypothetical protein MLD38_005363 [Melastoma candidum]